MRKFLLVAGVAALMAGCGEESDFENAINEK
ncbi:DNA-directed RNA polymerase subunit beta, partial [Salmonella enterica subsp. enterica serovar Butantan]|nr:DNA-directed RNA polymerase subunit beta [Salmonella enterica subsp. enterica serovar Butantan]